MTVEMLRLCGLDSGEAEQAACTLLDLGTGPRDLRSLLVLDDTALVVDHGPAYLRLDSAARVEHMLCVAVGPRHGKGRALLLPGNLGGTQGSPVLWVSDPSGIDWQMAAATIAIGHLPGKVNGLDLLVELLCVEEVFRRVHEALDGRVPRRVASPGLRLAGTDDEAATFAAALAAAIRRLGDPGQGTEGPFPALLPAQIGGASVADDGPLARFRDEVTQSVAAASDAVGRRAGLGGLFRRGDGGARAHLAAAGAALADLRDLTARLLREANTLTELTSSQRRLISDAGLRFPPGSAPAATSATAGPVAEQSSVCRAISEAIRGGDTLALVGRRLTLTERELKRRGSASYLPEVDERCPPSLLSRLADPPQRLSRTSAARTELGLDDAAKAAAALAELLLTVADREWSPAVAFPGEVARIRVALDGVGEALTEQATTADGIGAAARGARISRLGESLSPVLRDLVLRVVATEVAQPSTGGQEAFAAARQRTAGLVADWVVHVRDSGVLSRPAFATTAVHDAAPYADEDDVAEIREAVLYRPRQEMWQLCTPADLSMLDAVVTPEVVRFASRLARDALAGTLSGDQPVWISSGSYAGLLRLVPLRPGFVTSTWGDVPSMADQSSMPGPS